MVYVEQFVKERLTETGACDRLLEHWSGKREVGLSFLGPYIDSSFVHCVEVLWNKSRLSALVEDYVLTDFDVELLSLRQL